LSPIVQRFKIYHVENPHVYTEFSKYAKQLISVGHDKLSSSLIFERMRWESMIQTQGDEYKLNNNYRAYYARMFEYKNPEYSGYFSFRKINK
jgi:hypothetical protein